MATNASERRQYYRHPLRSVMEFRLGPGESAHSTETLDISFSGLAFTSHLPIEPGQKIHLTVGLRNKAYDLRAKVAYSVPEKNGRYRVGAAFLDMRGDFRRELTQSASGILEYQKELTQISGRTISEEEAATLWIHRNSPTP